VLTALYWLVKYNVLYQEYDVVIDPSNIDWMGDQNECILPILSCNIQTEKDDSPEDDEMGASVGQTMMDKLDNMDGIDMELSGTMSNTDFTLSSEDGTQLLEEIQKRKAEKGVTVNWPAFGESPISEYGEKRVFCMLFPLLYPRVPNGRYYHQGLG
jgi:hypothetical protein